MPSPKAVLRDIHDLKLDPTVAHSHIKASGRLHSPAPVPTVPSDEAPAKLEVPKEAPPVSKPKAPAKSKPPAKPKAKPEPKAKSKEAEVGDAAPTIEVSQAAAEPDDKKEDKDEATEPAPS